MVHADLHEKHHGVLGPLDRRHTAGLYELLGCKEVCEGLLLAPGEAGGHEAPVGRTSIEGLRIQSINGHETTIGQWQRPA